MTIEQAIKHAEQVANSYNDTVPECECAKEHRQLATWLRELQERRKAPEIIFCKDCANQYKPTCPFGVWINTPDDGHCHWAERRTDD